MLINDKKAKIVLFSMKAIAVITSLSVAWRRYQFESQNNKTFFKLKPNVLLVWISLEILAHSWLCSLTM